jgi:type II secretory pathway pseudopilin PulG
MPPADSEACLASRVPVLAGPTFAARHDGPSVPTAPHGAGLRWACPAGPRRGGFTLLEVVLAVSIAIGLLVVVLQFYSQATALRTQLLLEAERISSIRLVMETITADLRSARKDPASGPGLTGDATSLRLVRATPPSLANWAGGQWGRAAFPETDLRRVSYSLISSLDGTNLVPAGLTRTEEPCVELRRTLEVTRPGAGVEIRPAVQPSSPDPLSETICYLRFRYWDGANWLESWRGTSLPVGVEVTLGLEPLTEKLEPGETSPEVFRRTIYLPANTGPSSGASPLQTSEPVAPPKEVAP